MEKFVKVNMLKEVTNPVFSMVQHQQKMAYYQMKSLVLQKQNVLVSLLILI